MHHVFVCHSQFYMNNGNMYISKRVIQTAVNFIKKIIAIILYFVNSMFVCIMFIAGRHHIILQEAPKLLASDLIIQSIIKISSNL